MDNEYPEIMVDLETLGTGHDAHILSIGACDLWDVTDTFYCELLIEDQGRTLTPETVGWWMSQSTEARQIFFNDPKTKVPMRDGLLAFYKWVIEKQNKHKVKMWSHGATFDIPMIGHALEQYGFQTPWKFWNVRDTRTLIDTIKKLNSGDPMQPLREGVHHNAMDDAVHQALWMQNIMKILHV